MSKNCSVAKVGTGLRSGAAVVWFFLVAIQAARGQESPSIPLRLEVRKFPGQVHVPLRWSFLSHRLSNDRDKPFEGLCVTTFDDPRRPQFARRVIVPPRSRLSIWQPILVPDPPPGPPPDPRDPKIRVLKFRTLLLDGTNSDASIVPQDSGEMQTRENIWLTHPGLVTGVLPPPPASTKDAFPEVSIDDFIWSGRAAQRQKYNLVYLEEGLPPGGETSLEGFDQLIVAHEAALQDRAALGALRRWLYGGGRLWVMLDQVSDSALETLLGDECTIQTVDRITVTRVHLHTEDSSNSVRESAREFDRPVRFVRVVGDDLEVRYSLNGWPAAFWKTCGQGRLLVTTLGADAWVRPRRPGDPPSAVGDAGRMTVLPGPAYDDLTASFYRARPAPLLEPDVLASQAHAEIGYRIPSRGLVVGMLSGFAAVVIALGAWLLRMGEAQRLGIFGPLAASIASLSLVIVGRLHRDVPDMTAVTQFVQPVPGTQDVRAAGAAAMFVSQAGPVALSGTGNGWLMPEADGQDVSSRRLTWSGLSNWDWHNLSWSQGEHSASFAHGGSTPVRILARSTFDSEGLRGGLQLPEGISATDALLATSSGQLSVDLEADGTFHADADDLLAPGAYFQSALLTDEQVRRTHTLDSLLEIDPDEPIDETFLPGPTLLFWTNPWNLGTRWPAGAVETGAALVMLPLMLERPNSGESIRIPSNLITYAEDVGPGVDYPAGIYNSRTREWLQRSKPSTNWLRFQLPKVLMPLDAISATLTLKVAGPMKRLEVAALKEKRAAPIKTWIDPVGTLTLEIDDPALLEVDDQATLALQISLGDPALADLALEPTTEFSSMFRIEALRLEVRAVMLNDNSSILTRPQP